MTKFFRFVGVMTLALLCGAVGGVSSNIGGRCLFDDAIWECFEKHAASGKGIPLELPDAPSPTEVGCLSIDEAKRIHTLAFIIGDGRVGDLNTIEQMFVGPNSQECVELEVLIVSSCELLGGGAAGNCSQLENPDID